MQLLPEEVPGKCGGPPGNAFELVYAKVTDAVRRAVRKVDPVLAEWIRSLAPSKMRSLVNVLSPHVAVVWSLGQHTLLGSCHSGDNRNGSNNGVVAEIRIDGWNRTT